MKGLKKSFRLIYSNTHLRTRETLPLKQGCVSGHGHVKKIKKKGEEGKVRCWTTRPRSTYWFFSSFSCLEVGANSSSSFFRSFVLLAWKGGQFSSSSVTVPSHRRPSWSPIVSMSIAPAERERIFAFSLFRYDAIAPSLLLYYIKSNNSPFYIVLFFSPPLFPPTKPFFFLLMMDQMSNHIFPWKKFLKKKRNQQINVAQI